MSVIVPFHDAPAHFERCLAGLARSSVAAELVLVDDASSDRTSIDIASRAKAPGGAAARCLRMDRNRGPAAARNAGARVSRGDVLVFIDSDCVVHLDTLERIQRAFQSDPDLGALFGSYDDRPDAPGVVSRYRNLLHHFTHHQGAREAGTFWAGCGACRREVFERSGCFDERYGKPMIEDIELGMRWRAAGVKIHLLPEIQVTHLKQWKLFDMIRVDVARRAIPWTRLMLERQAGQNELNVTRSQRWCVALVYAAALWTCGLLVWGFTAGQVPWPAVAFPLLLLIPVLWINRRLYALFARRYGGLFALAGVGLHLLYYGYGGVGFLYARLTHRPS